MSIEQEVRESLRAWAETVDPTPLYGPALRARAEAGWTRRRALPRGAAAVVAAVAAVAAVLAALLAVPAFDRHSLPPAADTVDTWPDRGDLAGDAALLAAATRAWEAGPVLPGELPHREVRMLFAQRTPYGRYVMLSGRNALGHRRLAVLSDDPRDREPYRERLRLREDRAFPRERLLTYVEHRHTEALVLAVGSPDVTRLAWRDGEERWRDLRSEGGATAAVVDRPTVEVSLRAYRGDRRVAQVSASAPTRPYEPDDALLREPTSAPDPCQGGVCSAGGTIQRGIGVLGVLQQPGAYWGDMADQATQLWTNHALGTTRLRTSASGQAVAAMLPDGLGVHLAQQSVNGGAQHLVLYVDRPEWPVGRLYLARPFSGVGPETVSAVLPGRAGPVLVVFAGQGVGVRYRVGGGEWRGLRVDHGIGWAPVAPGRVEVEATHDGRVTAGPVDTVAPL